MRITIIKPLKIHNIILPNEIEGSYWIEGFDQNGIKRNLIAIEADNGRWKLSSNREVFVMSENQPRAEIHLSEGNFYQIRNDITKETFELYCSPVMTEYNCYDVEESLNNRLQIGSSTKCTINYPILDEVACLLQKYGNKVYITDNNSKAAIYVNEARVISKKEVKIGDIVFIGGLKFVLSLTNKNSNAYCIYINDNFMSSVKVNLFKINSILPINNTFIEDEKEIELPMYDEKEFFHKMPRFIQKDETLLLKVDAPPAKIEDKNNPVLLTVGPMITMSMTSMVTGYTAINNVMSGGSTWEKAAPSLVICGAMFASVFVWPLFTKWYDKITKRKNERERQQKYSAYIESKRQAIIEAKVSQSAILNNNYMDTKECAETILNKYTRLWERRVEDNDFLDINLGKGSYPMKIDIKYPEDHFSMTEDNLKDMVSKLGQEPQILTGVPIITSLRKNRITGIIGSNEKNEFTRRMLIQILALHSYDNLKIIILTDDEKEYNWKFLKHTPHCFNDDKGLRFFGTNNTEYKEICHYLNKIYEQRKEIYKTSEPKYENLTQNYLIITDSFKRIRDYDIIKSIIDNKKYLGFSMIIIDNKITNLPDKCTSFIHIAKEKGDIRNSANINETYDFSLDFDNEIEFDQCAKSLANIPIEIENNEEQLISKIGFLEMFDVGKIEHLNPLIRWQKNNPVLNLQAPVGIGKNGDNISIDLHEKYHGPHGLIAGMTGSGKSEFIITYILSMAVNYHPNEVQFILIDYKGGGLAGAFENKLTGVKLPHLVGTITNLDTNEIKRSLASIESELKRRQALFNKAREISGESTIDIYDYQQMYREGTLTEPVSHLFIISDEFAELKNQQPEFMEQLISTARIGRSLGVHLILATQKPSGVVDPQIWSNTRFRVCMRVQDKSDSNEVIKCPDAAFLKQTGRFYFQVGYNEVFTIGQAAYAGLKYIPSEKVSKSLNTSIDYINNIGNIIKKVDTKNKQETAQTDLGEELVNIVKYLDNIAKEEGIKCRPLWLDKIPEDIRIENLAKKYNYQKEDNILNPIIGEYDIPSKQEQKLLTLSLTRDGNTLIYGSSGNEQENMITTLLYSLATYHSPDEINSYIIDFGSGSLKMFQEYPIVGDILNSDDDEKIKNLYKMITTYIEERKKLFAEYNGDFTTYCKNSGQTVPNIIIVINNYESYQETFGNYDETLVMLSRECIRYGIYFVITVNTPNGLRFKLRQNFSTIYVLSQNNDDDYTTILGNIRKNYPAKMFGRGIFKTDTVYEFQTALITNKDDTSKTVKEMKDQFKNKYNTRAKSVPVLPETVGYKEIYKSLGKYPQPILGINKSDLSICRFDFNKLYATILTSLDLTSISQFLNPLINQLIIDTTASLVVINPEDFYIDSRYTKYYQYIDKKFNEIFKSLTDFLERQKKIYEENNYDKSIFNDKKKINCIIIGIETFKNRLSDENKLKFADLFNNGKDLGIINFILVDTIDKIKKIEIESWYKNCINNTSGIWVGNGINDQFSIKISQKIEEMKKDIPSNFCFVIKRGKVQYVKYVENFDLQIPE